MKSKIQYQCEFCNKIYSRREDGLRCEKEHALQAEECLKEFGVRPEAFRLVFEREKDAFVKLYRNSTGISEAEALAIYERVF